MNYRHQYHAGNFADVVKHAVLVQVVRCLQRKPKGFLYLDTHAGRGRYDLARAGTGDSLVRVPEWPDGIGRFWSEAANQMPQATRDYVELIRRFDGEAGNLQAEPRFYPGSPWIVRLLARPVDRLALFEKHPAENAALQSQFGGVPRVSVHTGDGYAGLRAMLPPPERRALVLIDPPFEEADEYARIARALGEALERFRDGVYLIWYPLTGRARADEFLGRILGLNCPPTLALELRVAGETSALKMKGCGVLLINPPWLVEQELSPLAAHLAGKLAREAGAGFRLDWLVREDDARAT